MKERAKEINERIDRAVARHLAIPRTWKHPRYAPGIWVTIDESIRAVHPAHPLAGKTVRVCHGEPDDYPCVPVELPGQTHLQETSTTGNAAIVPEVYIREAMSGNERSWKESSQEQ